MLHFEFRRDRLAEPHALKAFELGQRTIEVPFQARFVAEQMIELRCERNVLLQHFQLHHPLARPHSHHRNGVHQKILQNGDKAEPSCLYTTFVESLFLLH